jgi:hypothetical protein
MKYLQVFSQHKQKERDARWHHHIRFFDSFKNELKNHFLQQVYVLKKVFFFAHWCDVCGTNLSTNMNLRSIPKNYNKKSIAIISFYFYRILPNFLGKIYLKIYINYFLKKEKFLCR